MNKKELAEAIASKQNIDLKTVEKVINCSIDAIVEAVAQGDSVQFVGFGTFSQSARSERNGRNPKTKEAIIIPACKTPKFKAGKVFKDALN